MEPTCIAVDFDYTLAYFADPVEKGLFDIFRRRNVPEDVIKAAYKSAVNSGFSIERFALEVISCSNSILDHHLVIANRDLVRQEFQEWLLGSLTRYPDSLPFLERWWGKLPIAIVTSGDQKYQRQKVYETRVPCDHLYVVTSPKKKNAVLRDLLTEYGSPILFIEDNPKELDAAVARLGRGIITVLIDRPGLSSPHGQAYSRYSHIKVSSLEEVNCLIEEKQ